MLESNRFVTEHYPSRTGNADLDSTIVPCVGGVEYPIDEPADTMTVMILGSPYVIQVQYHVLRNITYVLLDAPVFRQQTKSEPYPPRMDDLDSAVYYSAWNQCIAEAMRRFPIDLYHINDYHGAVAPLHLLPAVIPCALSLHNAEFQGLWPMRSVTERDEVCQVYNLDPSIVGKYVQFGEVFSKCPTRPRSRSDIIASVKDFSPKKCAPPNNVQCID